MSAESQYLAFHGVRVHFRMLEPEVALKHRVLLLCSPMISTFHWRKLVPELSQLGCLLVLVDLPGFGLSDCSFGVPRDSRMRASIIWGILDEIDRRTGAPMSMWHLISHGTGCRTALSMFQQCPDSVCSQVYISPELAQMDVQRFANGPGRWFDRNILDAAGFKRMAETLSGYPMDDYVLEKMRMPLLRPGAKDIFLHVLREEAPQSDSVCGFCPVMAIWGGRDKLMDPREIRTVERLLPEAEKHVLKSAGHFPMETHSRALRDYLRGWFRYLET